MSKAQTTAELRAKVSALRASGSDDAARALLAARSLEGAAFFEYPWLAEALEAVSPGVLPFRLGVLSTFTVESLRAPLRALGLAQGFDFSLYFGGFGQLEQEVMAAGSGLGQHEPQAIVFAWQLRDLSPALAERFLDLSGDEVEGEVQSVLSRVRMLIEQTRRNIGRAAILVHAFVPPEEAPLGVIDFGHEGGLRRVVDALNSGLCALAGSFDSTYVVDCPGLARRCGSDWFSAAHWYTARAPLGAGALVELGREWVKFVRAIAGKTKKVLVADLDNTMWGGIVGEDGFDGIKIGTEYPGNAFRAFQLELKQFARRGIVLALNSKNNEADVREVFEKHEQMVLGWDDFAAKRVNWQDKVGNLKALAAELSLGIDSFVFIDDNPVEIELVQQALPEVTTVLVPEEPSELPGLLSRLGYFDSVIYSEEDRKRGEFYRAQAERSQLEQSSTDLESFYRSLDMKLFVYEVGEGQIPRVSQLTQRTNQFNMTTRRYTEADIRGFVESDEAVVRAYRLEDRFGDNGIIGVVIAKRQGGAWELDTFLLSCRVIGRKVEDAIVALLAAEAQAAGASALVGEFIPTKKNAPAKEVYSNIGFEKTEEDASGVSRWRLGLSGTLPEVADWFVVEQVGGEG